LVDAMDAENKVSITPVQNAGSKDHKEKTNMGEVIALIRMMPDGVINDTEIQTIMDSVKQVVKKPVRLGRVEVKNIAFGLRSVDVTVVVPDSEGGLDPIVEVLSKIKKIENVEVVDVGRI